MRPRALKLASALFALANQYEGPTFPTAAGTPAKNRKERGRTKNHGARVSNADMPKLNREIWRAWRPSIHT